jgi:hypothetical protein
LCLPAALSCGVWRWRRADQSDHRIQSIPHAWTGARTHDRIRASRRTNQLHERCTVEPFSTMRRVRVGASSAAAPSRRCLGHHADAHMQHSTQTRGIQHLPRTPPSCYLRATGGPPGGRARRSPKPAESTTHRITTQPHRRHTRMEPRHSHTSRPRAAGNWPTYPSPTSSAYCIPPRRWALARACGAAIAAAAAAAGAS